MTDNGLVPRLVAGLAPRPVDPEWHRPMVILGSLALAVVVGGVVSELAALDQPAAAGSVLAVGSVLWLVELLRTPSHPLAETVLLVAVGASGATLNALAPASTGFLLAFLAASGLGLRLPLRVGIIGTLAVAAGLDVGMAVGSDHVAASIATTDLGLAFVFAVAAAARSARDARARTAGLLAELEESRAAQAQAAALAERARLAREIHDILAHALSGLVMSLEGARLLALRSGADERVVAELVRSHQLAKSGLEDTGRAIRALRGDVLPGPDLLPRLVADAAATHGIRAELRVHGEPRPLPAEAALTLYRTAQECLTNTAKHAGHGASTVLTLTWSEATVMLEAVDTRREGVRPEVPASGYGLTGLRERAELAGGVLTAEPTGDGFAVRLRLPCARPYAKEALR